MGRAKEIQIRVIPAKLANDFIRKTHYSGKVVPNSCLHFGAFLDGVMHGVLSYGPPTDKSKVLPLVEGTPWDGMLELNRMAFDEMLPRNSESYCIGATLRMIKKQAPQIKWVLSFADGCQCGDGTIYRASNFILTSIKKNAGMRIDENGKVWSQVTFSAHRPNEMDAFRKMKVLQGFQLRYIYFIDKKWRKRLTVPEIPFSEIDKMGAGMYKGSKIEQAERHAKLSEAQLKK